MGRKDTLMNKIPSLSYTCPKSNGKHKPDSDMHSNGYVNKQGAEKALQLILRGGNSSGDRESGKDVLMWWHLSCTVKDK